MLEAARHSVLEVLCQSRTRTALLRWLVERGDGATVSELARRAGVTPRAAREEVAKLRGCDLVRIEAVGGSDVVRPNEQNPCYRHLKALLEADGDAPRDTPESDDVLRQALVAHGAPLAGVEPRRTLPLELALVRALSLARRDATVLRVLPVLVAKNAERMDWTLLKAEARRRKSKAELGFVVELTAKLLGRKALAAKVQDLRDGRVTRKRLFHETRSEFERRVAERNTPALAKKWGFLLNMGEDAFRATLEKHFV